MFVFLRLGVKDFYVCGSLFLHLGVRDSYVWGLGFLTFGISVLTLGG